VGRSQREASGQVETEKIVRDGTIREADDGGMPEAVLRLSYTSSADGRQDWSLALPESREGLWVVCIHGHGSSGDQLYTRQDMRDRWLPAFRQQGLGILTPDLRGNAWMSPLAASDLQDLLGEIRRRYAARGFVFFSGSMGGTSNLIYAALHPEDVTAVVALGAATDVGSYHAWCREKPLPIHGQIAQAIGDSYGGDPGALPEVYRAHSALRNAARLRMPIFLAHGEKDAIMPVEQARLLAERLSGSTSFLFTEVPGGSHDSPLSLTESLKWVLDRI